jgi:RHS repeat-associated protein
MRVGLLRHLAIGALCATWLWASQASAQAPSVTGLLPSSGTSGISVTISGTGFGSVQGTSTITLSGVAAAVTSWSSSTIVAVVPSGAPSGDFTVTVNGQIANSGSFTVTPLPSKEPLPFGWLDKAITPQPQEEVYVDAPSSVPSGGSAIVGSGGQPAWISATYVSGVFTLAELGQGITGTADGIHFAYQSLSGDGTIVARVTSVPTGAQAGVMVRETLNANATDVATFYQPSSAYFYDRASTGANSSSAGSVNAPSPSWVELVRSGNSIGSYSSADGVNWTQVGSTQTISMQQNVEIGLFVSSGTDSSLATATFDSVSVSPTSSPAPVISSLSATTGTAGSELVILGSGFGATQGASIVTLNDDPLTVNAWSATAIIITIPTGATSGPLLVSVAPTMNNSNPVVFQVTSQPLPSSWLNRDVGSVAIAGSATFANGTFTVNGSGHGIAGTADGMHFVYQPLTGDGTIIAEVASLSSSSQAGVMMRATLGPSSIYGAGLDNGNYSYFYDRTSTGGSGADVGYLSATVPGWVELVRSGNTISSYTSANGVTWTQVGTTQTISMAQNVYVGLFVTSEYNTSLATGTFANVSVSSSATPAPVITSLSATTGAVGSQIVISGSGFGATQGSSLVLLNGTAVTINSWSATTIVMTIPTGATTGLLVVSVAPSMNDSNPVMFEVTTQPLPTGWLDQDIGTVAIAGSATYASGTFTVKGSGQGIAGTADGMHFVYQPLSGNGTIIAQVTSVSSGAQVGVMIRDTLSAGTTYGATTANGNYSYFYDRTSTGGSGTDAGYVSATIPCWVEVTLNGGTISSYTSANGVTWTQVGTTQTISMAQNVYVGLFVSSVYNSSLATGTFANVSVSSSATPAPVITSLSATTGAVGSQIVISGSGFGATQGSSLVLLNGTAVTINSWSATTIVMTIPTGATTGLLVVSVAPSMNDSNPVMFEVTTQPLPTGWLDQDIGTVAIAGSATYASGTFTVKGSGQGIAGTADGMHFVYQPLSGNGTIIAQVTSVSSGAQVGVMIRDTLSAGTTYGATTANGNYSYFYDRTSTGGSGTDAGYVSATIPCWVEVTLNGGTISSYTSANGVTWTQVGTTQTISMAQNVYVGLFVSSVYNSSLATGTFANVSVSSSATPAPVITSLSATTGAVGTQITVVGSWFGTSQGSSSVNLNGAQVTVNSWSPTSILATIPSGATSGNVAVTVGSVSSNGVPFTVISAPNISGLSPSSGGIGASFTISGSNFGATQGSSVVQFNGTSVSVCATCWSATAITVAVPVGASSGNVVVAVSGVASNGMNFTVSTVPNIGGLTPPAAEIGGQVVIQGTGFGLNPTNNQVQFNGQVAAISQWSETSITAIVPPGATSGPVTVVDGGVSSNGAQFTVLEPLSVASISIPAGIVGSTVTITGTGFGGSQSDSVAAFNGSTASISSWSDTSIVAIVPPAATTGPVTVEVANITASGPTFEVTSTTQITDSLGNPSSYTSTIVGGAYYVTAAQGSGCSSCTIRGVNQYQYDALGNVLSSTDALGRITSYTYDSSNDVTSVTQPAVSGGTPTTSYTYNSFGEVLTMTDPLGDVTTNTYDANGNLTSVTSPAPGGGASASVTQFAYNSLGELTKITDPLGHITTLSYNSVGLIASITDAQNNVTTYGYDIRGNRTSVTDAMQNLTSFAYDTGNRLLSITYPGGATSSFTHDYRGRRITATDQNGKTTNYGYDDADRLTSITDAAQNTTTYSYDTENNLFSITDANSHTTSFAYDAFGRVTQTTFPSGYVETYGYDAVNNLTSKTDRKSQTIQYVYDALNRLTQKTHPDSTTVEYVYDLAGKIQQVTDPTGTYGFAYDNMGRQIGTTTQYSFLPNQTLTNSYTYDAASNRTGYTAPDSSTNTYTYDTLNRLSNLANSWAGSFGFSYDTLSRRTQLTRPNGVTTNYNYDNLSHLLSVLHQLSGSTIDGASYAVDSAGNRTAKTDQLAGLTSNYGYDAVYRLSQTTQGGATTESYNYDLVGNRVSSLGVSSYSSNSSNELTSTSSASYTYDYDGNTTSKTDAMGTTNYSWNYENRLTQVTLPGTSGTVTFQYDPFGRRIEKISPITTSIFAYDGNNLVQTVNATGGLVAHYAQTRNIDEPLARQQGSSTDYYEADGLGSVTSLSTTAGVLANTYTYDAFGNVTSSTGSVTNFLEYTGREFDKETGLYYYRARYYDPSAGRFFSEDPIRFIGGLNFYRYAGDEPTDLSDPFGLTDYNEQQTLELLQQAYSDATAGRIDGLLNIKQHSQGDWDFGWNQHHNDTWTRCGKKMNADQFGNYIAGFEGAAYDQNYFWTTGGLTAQASVEVWGIAYHMSGRTKAHTDPFDTTGRPDIRAGERDGWNFARDNGGCGCGGGGGW